MIAREEAQLIIINGVQWIRLGVELIGALVAGLGVLIALVRFIKAQLVRPPADFNAIRLVLPVIWHWHLNFSLVRTFFLRRSIRPAKKSSGWGRLRSFVPPSIFSSAAR